MCPTRISAASRVMPATGAEWVTRNPENKKAAANIPIGIPSLEVVPLGPVKSIVQERGKVAPVSGTLYAWISQRLSSTLILWGLQDR